MPRGPRSFSSTGIYHWIVRGVNKQIIFRKDSDYQRFCSLIAEYKLDLAVDILHYGLMSNHVHMLLRSDDIRSLSVLSHFVLRKYTDYFCRTYKWTGGLFQRPFKSFKVEDETYLLECGRYIERNPLKAGLARHIEEYAYSSYNYYAYGRKDPLITRSPAYETLDADQSVRQKIYRNYVETTRPNEAALEKELLRP